jgi:hypothetical protein
MKRLVVKAQLKSLQESLRSVNQRLHEIEQHILENQNDLTEYDYIKLSQKVNKLQQEKTNILSQLNYLNEQSKSKKEIGEYGKTSFYNLVAISSVPIVNASKSYFIKVYEIVNARYLQSGGKYVYTYMVTLSSQKPLNEENYFLSNQVPLTKPRNVIKYSLETTYSSIDEYVANYMEIVNKENPVDFEEITTSRFGKAFNESGLKDVLHKLEDAKRQLVRKYPAESLEKEEED